MLCAPPDIYSRPAARRGHSSARPHRSGRLTETAAQGIADVQDDVGVSGIDWDHNGFYHRLLLRQLPHRCARALDVGCGAGRFATKLAGRVEHVDALDRSPVMIDAARAVTPGNVTCLIGDFLRYEFADESLAWVSGWGAATGRGMAATLPGVARSPARRLRLRGHRYPK